jgi:FixJ family two-component response regulator
VVSDLIILDGPLTVRVREVLKLITERKKNKDVADILLISDRAVETRRSTS